MTDTYVRDTAQDPTLEIPEEFLGAVEEEKKEEEEEEVKQEEET